MNYCPTFDEVLAYAKAHDEEFGKWLLEEYNYSDLSLMSKLDKAAAFGLFYLKNH